MTHVEDHPDIDHPDVVALIAAAELPPGERGDSILKVMNAAGKSGWDNHQILALGSELADRWGKYTSANLYEHWTRLLQMLRNVRRHYPNPDQSGKVW